MTILQTFLSRKISMSVLFIVFSFFFLSRYSILDNILFLVVLPDLGEIYHLFCHVINAPTSTPILEYNTSRNFKKYMVFSFVRPERAYKGSQAGIF
jgi:hypothetical protein